MGSKNITVEPISNMMKIENAGQCTQRLTPRASVLGEPKYGPGSEPQWKAGRICCPAFYKALLEEPSRTKRREMLVAYQRSTRTQSYLDISGACE